MIRELVSSIRKTICNEKSILQRVSRDGKRHSVPSDHYRERRIPFGIDSVVDIKPGDRAIVAARTHYIFKPYRIFLPNSVAPYFLIKDIKIGRDSQLIGVGSIPGVAFAINVSGSELEINTMQISQDLIMAVVNISNESRRFMGWAVGKAVE